MREFTMNGMRFFYDRILKDDDAYQLKRENVMVMGPAAFWATLSLAGIKPMTLLHPDWIDEKRSYRAWRKVNRLNKVNGSAVRFRQHPWTGKRWVS